ncbi:3-isopropylmalate dehydratase large subunit [Acrasis kona]|uniref:3-isopropylmalate dehydratase large subunit n=1 Tax=Acrasis kona TaxID=1008807 RepID=A0AAW2YVU2_9EUKA
MFTTPYKDGFLQVKSSRWPHMYKKKYVQVQDNYLSLNNIKENEYTEFNRIHLNKVLDCTYGAKDFELKVEYTTDDSTETNHIIEMKAINEEEHNSWMQSLQKAVLYAKYTPTASSEPELYSPVLIEGTDSITRRLSQIYDTPRGRNSTSAPNSPTKRSSRGSSTSNPSPRRGSSVMNKITNRLSRVFGEDNNLSPTAAATNELTLVEQYYMEKKGEEAICDLAQLQAMIQLHDQNEAKKQSTTDKLKNMHNRKSGKFT